MTGPTSHPPTGAVIAPKGTGQSGRPLTWCGCLDSGKPRRRISGAELSGAFRSESVGQPPDDYGGLIDVVHVHLEFLGVIGLQDSPESVRLADLDRAMFGGQGSGSVEHVLRVETDLPGCEVCGFEFCSLGVHRGPPWWCVHSLARVTGTWQDPRHDSLAGVSRGTGQMVRTSSVSNHS